MHRLRSGEEPQATLRMDGDVSSMLRKAYSEKDRVLDDTKSCADESRTTLLPSCLATWNSSIYDDPLSPSPPGFWLPLILECVCILEKSLLSFRILES